MLRGLDGCCYEGMLLLLKYRGEMRCIGTLEEEGRMDVEGGSK